ncbi:MAG: hypothetical protein HDR08_00985 [Lachnospiraceae bacterium]|nr:hypothetical protein [Lachnospiraceae bacterium]
MRKKVIIIIIILAFLLSCSIFLLHFASEHKKEPKKESGQLSNVTEPMGNFPFAKYVLSAEEIANLQIDYESGIPVKEIMNRKAGYESVYDEFLQKLQWAAAPEPLTMASNRTSFYDGEEGCFISAKPIRFWEAYSNQMSMEEWILIFSKDFQKVAAVQIYKYEGEIHIGTCEHSTSFMKKVQEGMLAEPEEKFIFLFTGQQTLMLNSENEYWYAGYLAEPIKVEGDYYHTLDYETIGISYDEITAEENLFWVDF